MKKIKKQNKKDKKVFFTLDENLFVKLLLVIVISSLFLIGILSLLNKLWYQSSCGPSVNTGMPEYLIEKKIPNHDSNNPIGPVPPPPEFADDDEPIMCTMEYMPVCAWKNDGICSGIEDCPRQTYGNACVANAAHANIISEGECQ